MMPSTSPGSRAKESRFSAGDSMPGAMKVSCSTASRPVGRGRSIAACVVAGTAARIFFSRAKPRRTPVTAFQVPIAPSTGPSERPSRIEVAKIAAGLTSCRITSQAAQAMTTTCASSLTKRASA